MSEVDEARRTTFMWHSMGDACPQCQSLNGRIYTDQDIFDVTLWDPWWGDILNLETGQKYTHGGTGINCRCTCEVRVVFDVTEIEPVMDLKSILEMLL
jgi:hypothetical protein